MAAITRREGLLGLAAMAGGLGPGASLASDDLPVEVGLNEARSRFFLEVAMNGLDGFRFVLDTGATSHFVSAEVARALGMSATAQRFVRGFDGRNPASVVEIPSLRVGGVDLGRVSAIAWPKARLEGHDGLIGYPYLAPRAVIALGTQKLSLRSRGEGEGVLVRADVDDRGAVLVGGLPGAEGRFAFDTGAQDLIISRRYYERVRQTAAYQAAQKLAYRNKAGELQVIAFRPAALSFGDFVLSSPVVRIDAADGREGAFEGVDALLGVAQIRRFVWAIDPAERRLRVLSEVASPRLFGAAPSPGGPPEARTPLVIAPGGGASPFAGITFGAPEFQPAPKP